MTSKPTALHIDRVSNKTYIGRNARGGEVRISTSDADGALSPGELLQLAMAACGILSSDHTLASRLGDDFAARVHITATKPHGENRYDTITTNILTNMSSIEPAKQTALIDRAKRAIERYCTVSHTLDHGAEHTVTIRNDAHLAAQIEPEGTSVASPGADGAVR